MNVLFFSAGRDTNISHRTMYGDLAKRLHELGHTVTFVWFVEKRYQDALGVSIEHGIKVIRSSIGDIENTGLMKKAINTLGLGYMIKHILKKSVNIADCDLVIYPTPYITYAGALPYIKKHSRAITFLMLKDIFPQNAVDLGQIKHNGMIYKVFRRIEKKLYRYSDIIGCMSQANVEYLVAHNPNLANNHIIDVFPNCISENTTVVSPDEKSQLRDKYGIPKDKRVFVYGGNLGKPQGIPFAISCFEACRNLDNVFFLVVGDGTEFNGLQQYVNSQSGDRIKLYRKLPKEDYERILSVCDVGLIFLDYRFTIPNFPSRILSYMQMKLPILAVTDGNSDVGSVIVNGQFGWRCDSDDVNSFIEQVNAICELPDISILGENARNYYLANYTTEKSADILYRLCTMYQKVQKSIS